MHKSGDLTGDFADDKSRKSDDKVTKINEIPRSKCIFQHNYMRCRFMPADILGGRNAAGNVVGEKLENKEKKKPPNRAEAAAQTLRNKRRES